MEKLRIIRRYRHLILLGTLGLLLAFGAAWPAFQKTRTPAKIARAKLWMENIAHGIEAYHQDHDSFPISAKASRTKDRDFTLGTFQTGSETTVVSAGDYFANNSETVGILIAATHFWNGAATVNTNHCLNSKKQLYIDEPRDPPAGKDANQIGIDGVYRDPWGNPYIITFNLNHDAVCDGPIYRLPSTSFVIWSFGPDGKANPKQPTDEGDNLDNIVLKR